MFFDQVRARAYGVWSPVGLVQRQVFTRNLFERRSGVRRNVGSAVPANQQVQNALGVGPCKRSLIIGCDAILPGQLLRDDLFARAAPVGLAGLLLHVPIPACPVGPAGQRSFWAGFRSGHLRLQGSTLVALSWHVASDPPEVAL